MSASGQTGQSEEIHSPEACASMEGLLQIDDVKADGAGLRSPGPHAMADRLAGILGNQPLELGLGALMVEISLAGIAKEPGELRPAVGRAHVDNANSLDPRPG